jgi:hypothetical protein
MPGLAPFILHVALPDLGIAALDLFMISFTHLAYCRMGCRAVVSRQILGAFKPSISGGFDR